MKKGPLLFGCELGVGLILLLLGRDGVQGILCQLDHRTDELKKSLQNIQPIKLKMCDTVID